MSKRCKKANLHKMAYTLRVRQSISVRGNENGNPNEISLHTGDIVKNLKFWIV